MPAASALEVPPVVRFALMVIAPPAVSEIAPEVAEHLFSPFFSTKVEGMGIGLKICRTTLEFHGGTLNYVNNPLGGTIFRFSLPSHSPQLP